MGGNRACDAVLALYNLLFAEGEVEGEEAKEAEAFRGIKFHLLAHIPDFIREYGMPSGFDAETWEMAHKFFVKRLFRMVAPCLYGQGPYVLQTALLKLALNRQVRRRFANFLDVDDPSEVKGVGGVDKEMKPLGGEFPRTSKSYTTYMDWGLQIAYWGAPIYLRFAIERGTWFEEVETYGGEEVGLSLERLYEDLSMSWVMGRLGHASRQGEGETQSAWHSRGGPSLALFAQKANTSGDLVLREGVSARRRGGSGGHLVIRSHGEHPPNHVWLDPKTAYGREADCFGKLAEVIACLQWCYRQRTLPLLLVRATHPDSSKAMGDDDPLVKVETIPDPFGQDLLYAYRLVPAWSLISGALGFVSHVFPEASEPDRGRVLWVMPLQLCNRLKPCPLASETFWTNRGVVGDRVVEDNRDDGVRDDLSSSSGSSDDGDDDLTLEEDDEHIGLEAIRQGVASNFGQDLLGLVRRVGPLR